MFNISELTKIKKFTKQLGNSSVPRAVRTLRALSYLLFPVELWPSGKASFS